MVMIGKIREIWRYPVKSMGGEKLDSCTVELSGLWGDRYWALRDEAAGEIRGAKYLPKLMQCSSRYCEQPIAEKVPHVDITLPDGTCISSRDSNVNACLSRLLEREVTLWPLMPASNKAHYRRAQVGSWLMGQIGRSPILRRYIHSFIRYTKLDGTARKLLSRESDESLPDFSLFPPELFEFTSPPGTYFDAFPIHLLTTASLKEVQRLNPTAIWDVRRFRPNFLIETQINTQGLIEANWGSRSLRLGQVGLKCSIPTVRCGMTTHAQASLPQDSTVLRTIVRQAGQNLGIYASVIHPGQVVVGDEVELDGEQQF